MVTYYGIENNNLTIERTRFKTYTVQQQLFNSTYE